MFKKALIIFSIVSLELIGTIELVKIREGIETKKGKAPQHYPIHQINKIKK